MPQGVILLAIVQLDNLSCKHWNKRKRVPIGTLKIGCRFFKPALQHRNLQQQNGPIKSLMFSDPVTVYELGCWQHVHCLPTLQGAVIAMNGQQEWDTFNWNTYIHATSHCLCCMVCRRKYFQSVRRNIHNAWEHSLLHWCTTTGSVQNESSVLSVKYDSLKQ